MAKRISDDSIADAYEAELEAMEVSNDEDQANPLPIVELSFSSQPGGAWDDRELVKAYDAALSEFNAHHPGPGSWLDKATVALAKGHPLPGAESYGTAWYSASLPSSSVEPESGPSRTSTQTREPKSLKANGLRPANPYTTRTPGVSHNEVKDHARMTSPAYMPPSPTVAPSRPDPHGQSNRSDDYDVSYDLAAAGPSEQHPTPSMTSVPNIQFSGGSTLIEPTGQVLAAEAMSLAMTAQYWAGYWMGVAQTKLDSKPLASAAGVSGAVAAPRHQNMGDPVAHSDEEGFDLEHGSSQRPSNLIVTQRQFGTIPSHLKR